MDASLLIVGAGPAGLLAALAAARRRPPHGVLVVDRLPVPGAKLAASGGGRGNLSHLASEEEFAAAFGRHGRFTIPAFRALPPEELRGLLAGVGVPTVVDDAGRVYPRSQSAAQVRDALVAAGARAGVRFAGDHAVQSLAPPDAPDAPWRVDSWSAQAVLLAAGGQSAPRLGSDGSGFALARALGHDLVPPVPALTSLRTVEEWPATLSGLSLPDVGLSLAGHREAGGRGELLFTHRGVSGPAVLNLSGRVARLLHAGEDVVLRLELLREAPDFQALRREAGSRTVLPWLARQLPRALASTLLDLAGIPADQTFARLAAAQEKALSGALTALPLRIRGTGGFDDSMATAGGVALKTVRPDTLASRLAPRLFFAGEILDLDGPTGGWNLHWAFCSGHLAGTSALPPPA